MPACHFEKETEKNEPEQKEREKGEIGESTVTDLHFQCLHLKSFFTLICTNCRIPFILTTWTTHMHTQCVCVCVLVRLSL